MQRHGHDEQERAWSGRAPGPAKGLPGKTGEGPGTTDKTEEAGRHLSSGPQCPLGAAEDTPVSPLTLQRVEEVAIRTPLLQVGRLRLREATTCLRLSSGRWWSWPRGPGCLTPGPDGAQGVLMARRALASRIPQHLPTAHPGELSEPGPPGTHSRGERTRKCNKGK